MQRTLLAGLMLGFAFSSLASAQETETLLLTVEPYRPPSGLTAAELTVGLGTVGRATSGTPLDGHGYDGSQGPAVDVATRFLFGKNRFLRFGFSARGLHQRGRGFGREGFGFASTVVDLTITARTMFPCMSNDARKVWFALSLGPSGGWHDAGRGRGDMATDDQGARLEAARTLDHVGLGWVVGVDLGLQFGAFLVDLAVDVRQHFGVDTVVGSHFLPSAVLRAGWAFDTSSY
ncbi:MAG: hypothetical protein H6721_30330 [Sandaracinus sp.]|nr:hypothetical protein [Sandaracinus sp.]MCB9621255.1 hypothetical protein [Sandaracinus sp.]MCB9622197.1 hypothetical protein [Sandaracinus sp.]MCB9636427.1 hypothetical protein [Sandaracinus sp.]